MSDSFFNHPILNSPYDYPARYWELDESGQPTQKIIEHRRRAEFITPIPKPKKRKASATQQEMVFDEGKGLSTAAQQYDPTSIINELRQHVNQWRALPPNQWQVTPETARLLQHWRHHDFGSIRPFFCQVEAVETAIKAARKLHRVPSSVTTRIQQLEIALSVKLFHRDRQRLRSGAAESGRLASICQHAGAAHTEV